VGDEVVIEGEVARVTFESDRTGFRVIKLKVDGEREPVSVVGEFPRVGNGARVRVTGTRETSPKHGVQIKASMVTELGPSTLRGLERYLGSGAIKGIGDKSAKRIVEHFGINALQVLDESPEKLAEVPGLGKSRALQIAEGWRDQRGVREIMVFLQAHGASLSLAQRIHKRFGPKAMQVVSNEPYRLAMEVSGVGFLTADRIAQSIGIAKDAPERMQAGVLHAMGEMTDAGHCWSSEEDIVAQASTLLGDPGEDLLRHALAALTMGGYVIAEDAPMGVDSRRVYYTRYIHRAEQRFAQRLLELAARKPPAIADAAAKLARFESSFGLTLAPEQRQAALAVAESTVLVVTGGPGVGKTTVLRAILALLGSANVTVRLAAPTGRAAKRIAETTGQPGSTLHRLLEFDPKTGGFKRGLDAPIDAGAVIVDEASMVDLPLADALAQATALGSRLILVGDVDQLPSIGPGAVLRDVIASRAVPCVRLVHIFRQAQESLIVQNAHRINAGEPPQLPPSGEGDFFMTTKSDPESAKTTVLDLVRTRIPRRFGLDPLRDVQVLVPMNRGEAGSISLNLALQAALNPSGPELVRPHRTLRRGDKVMQLRNDYDKDVWNGDLGFIEQIDVEARTLKVRFDEQVVSYDEGETDELALAYACTIHKSQGSEYPAVVVVMLASHFVMLSKSLLYTAITRGKRLVVLVTDKGAVKVALSRDRRGDRRTRLAERLQSR
jgi:exodeoxyribonuclease V alpha subunit